MCGINGFNFSDKKLIKKMNECIKHRGPNGSGIYVDKKVSFGQVRLSILDLSNAGKQPMKYRHKNIEVEIIFNGEIYNYIEIKKVLEKKGYIFRSSSDTEVITAAYLEYGFKCVNMFNGMWSFAIYDKAKKIIFCSRDRFGVKPFYYYLNNKKFIFSSEIKSILAHNKLDINTMNNIDNKAIDLYFSIGFIPSPLTIYKNIKKLPQGHNIIYNLKTKKAIIKKYYELPDYSPKNEKKWLINEGKKLLEDAVRIRMRSDVPIGAFLSGGLDSSTVVGIMRKFTELNKLNTFSIGFRNEFDETKYINIVKNYFKTIHHNYIFENDHFTKWIDRTTFHYDEPFADFSLFPTFQVSEMAKKKVTVVLSGDGGDEVFGGYNIYKIPLVLSILRIMPKMFRKNIKKIIPSTKIRNILEKSLKNNTEFYSSSSKNITFKKWASKCMKYCLKKSKNNLSEALRIFDILFNTLGDNYCTKVDRASMAYAIEVRSPFMDYRLIEYSQKIPSNMKVNIIKTKILLRELVKDIVPKQILNLKKHGFGAPINQWFKRINFNPSSSESLRYIEKINPYWKNIFLEEKSDETLNMRLYFFNLWCKRWIKE